MLADQPGQDRTARAIWVCTAATRHKPIPRLLSGVVK